MPQSCLQSQMNLSMNGGQDQVSVISDVFFVCFIFCHFQKPFLAGVCKEQRGIAQK